MSDFHVTPSALIKFELPYLLPDELEKVLYLDGDIIVQKDLTVILDEDIENVYAGVVSDLPTGAEIFSKYYHQKYSSYFNAGVLLLNLKKMRAEHIKNYGTADNNVTIEHCSDTVAQVNSPSWFKNEQGSGVVVHSKQGNVELVAKCIGAGDMRIQLRGKDCRDNGGKRYPVWTCVTCLRVDGNELINSPHLVWHDKPFVYNLNVTDGQIVKINMEWQPATDFLAKEREVNLKHVDEMQQEINRLGKAEAVTGKQLRETREKVKQLEEAKANTDKELKNVKNGWSFKIGRIITYVPRTIKDSLKK